MGSLYDGHCPKCHHRLRQWDNPLWLLIYGVLLQSCYGSNKITNSHWIEREIMKWGQHRAVWNIKYCPRVENYNTACNQNVPLKSTNIWTPDSWALSPRVKKKMLQDWQGKFRKRFCILWILSTAMASLKNWRREQTMLCTLKLSAQSTSQMLRLISYKSGSWRIYQDNFSPHFVPFSTWRLS